MSRMQKLRHLFDNYLCTVCKRINAMKQLALFVQFVKGDLQSADLLNHVLTTEEIDTVMHFAAQVTI